MNAGVTGGVPAGTRIPRRPTAGPRPPATAGERAGPASAPETAAPKKGGGMFGWVKKIFGGSAAAPATPAPETRQPGNPAAKAPTAAAVTAGTWTQFPWRPARPAGWTVRRPARRPAARRVARSRRREFLPRGRVAATMVAVEDSAATDDLKVASAALRVVRRRPVKPCQRSTRPELEGVHPPVDALFLFPRQSAGCRN